MYVFTNSSKEKLSFEIKPESLLIIREKITQVVFFEELIGVFIPTDQKELNFSFDFRYTKSYKENYGLAGIKELTHRKIIVLSLNTNRKELMEEFRFQLLKSFYAFDSNNFQIKNDPISGNYFYKKIFVIVNPNSGKKGACQIYERVKNLLVANGILPVMIISLSPSFVVEYMKTMSAEELISYDAFLCVSGDGTPFEVINNYMSRKDIDHVKHPLSLHLLPAGSGCALLENTTKFGQNSHSIENALHALCHFRRHRHFLQNYKILCDGGLVEEHWGFLSLNYGFFADVDIESEFLRFLGNLRFDIYGFFKYFRAGKYRHKVYLPIEPSVALPLVDQPVDLKTNVQLFDEKIYSFYAAALPYFSKDYFSSGILNSKRGVFDVQIFPTSLGKMKFLKYLMRHPDYKTPNSLNLMNLLQKEFRIEFQIENNEFPNVVIDGETFKGKNVRAVQGKLSDTFIYLLT